MMIIIKSIVSHVDFIAGRQMSGCVHREDLSAGECVGMVDDADQRASDTVIDAAAYDVLVTEIRGHNRDNPLPTPPSIQHGSELYRGASTDAERIQTLARIAGVD